MRRRLFRVLAMLAAAAVLAGCGGSTLDRKALQQEAKGLQSLAAEGGLLAGDAARGRSTSVFTRVHATFLRETARASVTTLAPARAPAARRLKALAARVAADLDRLSRSGSDRARQARLQHELEQAAQESSKVGKSL